MSRATPHSQAGHAHAGAHDRHDHPGLSVSAEKSPGKAEVRLTVTSEELERARGREFAALSRRVSVKGFRPGKTPRAMLEKHFGAQVDREVAEHFLRHAYEQAVSENELRPASFPRVPLDENPFRKGEAWSVTFEIVLRPEFELGQLEGLEVEGRDTSLGDEELDRALEEIRRANSRAEPAGEEPLEADGLALATLDFFRPGSEESCLTREGIRVRPKEPPQGIDPSAFEETLVGARKGEQRSMEMDFPANFPLEEARGERGTVRFTLNEVMRVVPPTDQELFDGFQATDEASLREAVAERIRHAKAEAEEQRIESELMERVLEAHDFELSEKLVEDQVQGHRRELLEKLAEQGLDEAEAKKRADEETERARTGAIKGLKAVFLVEEIARAKGLEVTGEDVTGEMAAIAERNGTTPEEVARYYRDEGLLRQLGLELSERKVRRYLRTSAVIRPPA